MELLVVTVQKQTDGWDEAATLGGSHHVMRGVAMDGSPELSLELAPVGLFWQGFNLHDLHTEHGVLT
jgi:hypothetical protein